MAQWFNSFVYRRKQNGKLRLHLKTNKDFNAAIQIEHHVALSLEEILLNLKDAKVLSYNGEKNADTETWSGEKSLLTLLHLGDTGSGACPYSLKMSQEVFRAKMDQTFEGKWLDLLVARMTT